MDTGLTLTEQRRMPLFANALVMLLAIYSVQASRPSPEPVVFAASTPCDMIPRTLLSIPAGADCEFITWQLTLRRDVHNQTPTTYNLRYTYGMAKAGTRGFVADGTTKTKTGRWDVVPYAGNRVMYRLNPDSTAHTITFIRLDDNLLHLLDPQGKLMIGHGGWSYTMNRKKPF